MPYDPLSVAEPDTMLSADGHSVGGPGIFVLKKSMDEMTYRHEGGKNILSIRNKIGS